MVSSTAKIITLMGPTATGKTDIAIELAKQLPIEIVSVDSALVYRGLNIGSAKPDAKVLEKIPHHLIDIISPEQNYSVATFLTDAKQAIQGILARNKIPLLVGGTMLYFKAFLEGLADIPAVPDAIRRKLQQRVQEEGLAACYQALQKIDPVAAARIHANDQQRITRALEVYYATGKNLTSWWQAAKPAGAPYEMLQLSLMPENRAELHEMLAARFQHMLAQGFIAEVENLKARYQLHADLSSMRSVGYRQVWQYLAGDINYNEMVEQGIAASRQLAKRQITWLRAWQNHQIVFAYQPDTIAQVQSKIFEFLNNG